MIAADCTAYAYANFHQDFIRGKVVLVGCPKLDSVDYSEKLEEIIQSNNISSMTVVRMEVPCCGGLEWQQKSSPEQREIHSVAGCYNLPLTEKFWTETTQTTNTC